MIHVLGNHTAHPPQEIIFQGAGKGLGPIVEPQLKEEQCGFCPFCGTVDQLFTLGGLWDMGVCHPVYMCFVHLEKAYDRVPRGILWGVLREYGVLGPLVRAILVQPTCVRILGTKLNLRVDSAKVVPCH